jgi:hypothetical protein
VILTLAWKEGREHRSIWLTMVVMTGILGFGLPRIIEVGNPAAAVTTATLAILAMAGAYGVVCGALMLAGECEGGTLPFLDVFLGRRGLLWFGKFFLGAFLALAEGFAVGSALVLLKQDAPDWLLALVGVGNHSPAMRPGLFARAPGPELWLVVLPLVTLEAYAWGLLGSSFTERVLSGAAIAAVIATPIWLFAICAPPPVFLSLRILASVVALCVSYFMFVTQPRETRLAPVTAPDAESERLRRFLDTYEAYEREENTEAAAERPAPIMPILLEPVEAAPTNGDAVPAARAPAKRRRRVEQAESPFEVLWWLTFQQAWVFFAVLAVLSLVVGLLIPAHGQLLWPLATLLLGVACGTASFAPEQRDLSYQFLAAQHFPLYAIWRFKIGFWLAAAAVTALLLALAGSLVVLAGAALLRAHPPAGAGLPTEFHFGTLRELLGPVLFFGIWLAYGFCAGQVFVWLCRKSILAVLLASMAGAAALSLWLPSLLCRGMNGWQLWVLPVAMLVATRLLVRAWAAGRIKERRPMTALAGCAAVGLLWAGGNFGYRAWELPDVGAPVDPAEFRKSIPGAAANTAGQLLQEAVSEMEQAAGNDGPWLAKMAEVTRLSAGVIEAPRADGQPALLRHLATCRKMTDRLRTLSRDKRIAGEPGPAFEHLAQILALSRNLRNKAPVESYLVGVESEAIALDDLQQWLAQGKPAADLRKVLDELNRHAAETPAPVDCVRTECFRAGGMLANPIAWNFASGAPRGAGKVPERWLAGGIALSLDMPWEAERAQRLWRLVWVGLFRAVETPPWQLPQTPVAAGAGSETTRQILHGWLPAAEGRGASITRDQLARQLDASWLSDEHLYCPVVPLRTMATRARWRLDASRQAVALALLRAETGKPAQALADLVPKYLPELPIDPYSGQPFRYRVSAGEQIENVGDVRPDQGVLWSTGPDRLDHGGRKHGGPLADDDANWSRGGFDLVTPVPRGP